MTSVLCIAGGAHTGKTVLAHRLALVSGTATLDTDELMGLPWSTQSEIVARKILGTSEDIIISGIRVPYALRKALKMSPKRPCDRLLVMPTTEEGLLHTATVFNIPPPNDGQINLSKCAGTVMSEIHHELVLRGVQIEFWLAGERVG